MCYFQCFVLLTCQAYIGYQMKMRYIMTRHMVVWMGPASREASSYACAPEFSFDSNMHAVSQPYLPLVHGNNKLQTS